MRKYAILALFALIVPCVAQSCAGMPTPAEPIRPYETLRKDALKEIAVEKPELAIQEAYLLKLRPEFVSDAELAALIETSIASLESDYAKAIAAKDFSRALSCYDSLLALDRASDPALKGLPNRAGILEAQARNFAASGKSIAAVAVALSIASDADDSFVAEMAILAAATGNVAATKKLRSILEGRKLALPPSVVETSERKSDYEELLRATVTVKVDRGILLKNGMGYPNILIGSGFFIEKSGYLLTNYHVISSEVDPKYEGVSHVYVKLYKEKDEWIPAKVVGWDPLFDLALLKIEVEAPAIIGFTGQKVLKAGDKVFTIGSPVGLESSLSSGIVSAPKRPLFSLGDAIQIDLAVNQGNSGGPLFDEEGELCGIVFAGLADYQGLNFAIPADVIVKELPKLYEGGKLSYQWLGMGLYEEKSQLYLQYLVPRLPSGAAGFGRDFRLVEVNGRPVSTIGDIHALSIGFSKGSLVRVTVEKDGKRAYRLLALNDRPDEPFTELLRYELPEKLFGPMFGIEVSPVGNDTLGPNYIVDRVYRGSEADQAGISEADTLTMLGMAIDEENRVVYVDIKIRQRKAGFLESYLRMGSYLDSDSFL